VDGSIIACCATGTSTRDSLLSWVRFLQRDNPALENIPILFTLHSPLGPVVPLSEEELNLKKT
jgi:signaling intermediate in Toll pathway protein